LATLVEIIAVIQLIVFPKKDIGAFYSHILFLPGIGQNIKNYNTYVPRSKTQGRVAIPLG